MLKSRLNASTLLAEMFDRKQNILLTKMLNTRHQTWYAKRFNIVELTNVVQQCYRSFSPGLRQKLHNTKFNYSKNSPRSRRIKNIGRTRKGDTRGEKELNSPSRVSLPSPRSFSRTVIYFSCACHAG